MAAPTTKPDLELTDSLSGVSVPAWPMSHSAASSISEQIGTEAYPAPSPQDALQALLAFSSLHDQVRRRRALAVRHVVFDAKTPLPEFEPTEQFVLDDVLKLVAERALAITGADGLAIALAENNEIVLRAAAGIVRPDVGARIDRDSAFSGACFRTAQVVNCDDTETDPRVNLQACRKLGARSMVAVPLCGRRRVIGVLEAFSSWPFGFNDSDIRNLSLLAELVLAALKPEDEDRFAESAQAAASKLEQPKEAVTAPAVPVPTLPAAHSTAASAVKATVPPGPVTPKPLTVPAATPAPTFASTILSSVDLPSLIKVPETPAATPVELAVKGQAPLVETTAAELTTTEAPAVAANAEESAPMFGQLEAEKAPRSFGKLGLLIGIVIVAAFAAGFWWKYSNAQLGNAVVRSEPSTIKPTNPAAQNKPAEAAPSAATATPAAPADTTSEGTESDTPAAPQELSKFPHVTGVRHWSSPDSSTVVLDLEDQVQYEAHRLTGPDRIYFDLHDTQLAPDLLGKSIEVGDTLINRIRVAQPVSGMTRIVLETKADTNFSVSLESNPYRLVVEVRKIGTNPKSSVNLFPNAPEVEKAKLSIVIPPPTKEDLQLKARVPKMRIVVDAGHGGWDLGTVGRRGLLEKDLVLEIAQRLGKLLESRLGADVIYTRQDDNYIPLDERAEIANQSQADLFVSVHANYSDLPSARGVETYYTNTFSAPGSKEAGSKDADSHTVAGSMKSSITPALSQADLHDRIEQSRRLAASVQRSMYGTLSVQNPGLRDRGIKEAGFVVLTESSMPGILAEVSFVSSPTDEQKLRRDGYREQIAEALYKGIARYAASSRGVKVASAAK
jgi:N-acetylmuramoyl-L-alanine amidase/putative methionine-R-sulfoxide reductase with GAF domain